MDGTVGSGDDVHWMREALVEADAAASHGDVPVGCVLVNKSGLVIGRGHNRREVDQDPTAHAEVVGIKAAATVIGHWRLEGVTAYVTLEPCPMCAGALLNARVARVVYGASDPKAGAIHSLFSVGSDLRLNHRFASVGGILEEESVLRLRAFFAKLRAAGEK